MTKHRDFEELIQKCLDREISVDENITLQLHLSQCPDCSSLYNELVSTEQAIVSLVEFTPNHGFNNRVLEQIKVKKSPVWAKVAAVFGGAWIATVIALLLSPLSSDIFNRVLTASPSIVRFVDNVHFIGVTLTRVLSPLAKNQVNPTLFIIGACLSIGMFLFFGKLFSKKEIVCTV